MVPKCVPIIWIFQEKADIVYFPDKARLISSFSIFVLNFQFEKFQSSRLTIVNCTKVYFFIVL